MIFSVSPVIVAATFPLSLSKPLCACAYDQYTSDICSVFELWFPLLDTYVCDIASAFRWSFGVQMECLKMTMVMQS